MTAMIATTLALWATIWLIGYTLMRLDTHPDTIRKRRTRVTRNQYVHGHTRK